MTLTEFLVFLAQNPAQKQEFEAGAEDYLASVDLTPEHKELLLTTIGSELMDEVRREDAAGEFTGDPTVKTVFHGSQQVMLDIQTGSRQE